jgi:hypothetical protein
MKKIAIGLVFALILLVAFIPSASAFTAESTGKGAIAKWTIPGSPTTTTIYAFLEETNNGKDGLLSLLIVRVTVGSTPPVKAWIAQADVHFKWNMNHITVTVPIMEFYDGTQALTGHESVTITFDSIPTSLNGPLYTGMAVDGSWKQATAEITLNNINGNPPTQGTFSATTSLIYHGHITVSI